MNDKAVNLFLDTAVERYNIWLKRIHGDPRPWTVDPILHKYSFCNVFREDDKCTGWIIKNIVEPRPPIATMWPAIIVYRYISSMNLFRGLKDRLNYHSLYDLNEVHKVLIELVESGEKFNGCFIRNPKIKGGWTKIHHVPFLLVREIRQDGRFFETMIQHSFETLTKYLSQFSATSGFMGHQYCCDLEYSEWFNPTDKYSYATMGPGSKQGMNIICGFPRHNRMKQDEWVEHARVLRLEMSKRFHNEFGIEVSMQEVQNWLCEFQKYVKFRHMERTGQRYKARLYHGR